MVPEDETTLEIPECFALMFCFGRSDHVLFKYLEDQYNSGDRMVIIIGNNSNCTSPSILNNTNYPEWELIEAIDVNTDKAMIYISNKPSPS